MMRQPNELPASLKNIDMKAALRRSRIFDKQTKYIAIKEAALPLAKKLVESRKKPEAPKPIVKAVEPRKYVHLDNDQAVNYWRKQIHTVEVTEAKFEKKVEQFIVKMVNGFVSHLDSEIGTTKRLARKTKGYFDDNEDELMASAQLDFGPLLLDQAQASGQEAYKLTGLSGGYSPQDYKDVISSNVERFAGSMIATDKEKLTDIISHGIDAGKSVPEIRGQIQNDFENYSKSQAQRITRTEVLRVSNQAALDAYDQSGVVEAKQWLTAGAVDECEQYNGQIVYLSDNFYGTTDEFADGDPPLHPNCRCVIIPVVENSHPGQGLWDNEDGFVQLEQEDPDATQTFWRGDGGQFSGVDKSGTNFFGNAFYVAPTRSMAAQFGPDITKFQNVNLPQSLVLNISTMPQYEALVKDSIKYASAHNANIDVNVALPKYIQHLGFKAATVPEEVEPMVGVGIFDKKVIKHLKEMQAKKSGDPEYEVYAGKIKDLEDMLDKRTRAFKELQSKQLEDEEYVKELEGLLDEKRTIAEDF